MPDRTALLMRTRELLLAAKLLLREQSLGQPHSACDGTPGLAPVVDLARALEEATALIANVVAPFRGASRWTAADVAYVSCARPPGGRRHQRRGDQPRAAHAGDTT